MEKPNKVFEEGRSCRKCGKRLSIYNAGDYCFCHRPYDQSCLTTMISVCTSPANIGRHIAIIDYYGEPID